MHEKKLEEQLVTRHYCGSPANSYIIHTWHTCHPSFLKSCGNCDVCQIRASLDVYDLENRI